MAEHILLVNDGTFFRRQLSFHLMQAGYRVSTAANAEDALALARSASPDLVLLDTELPGIDGVDALGYFRKRTNIPIILLTARGHRMDEVVALDLGADDYVVKPFDLSVLLARIKAVLRRSRSMMLASPAKSAPVVVGDLVTDPTAHTVTVRGQPLELARREFDLLHTLALYPRCVFSVGDLLARVWGVEYRGQSQVVYVHIRWLRVKLEENPCQPRRIVTVRGVGYKLEPQYAA